MLNMAGVYDENRNIARDKTGEVSKQSQILGLCFFNARNLNLYQGKQEPMKILLGSDMVRFAKLLGLQYETRLEGCQTGSRSCYSKSQKKIMVADAMGVVWKWTDVLRLQRYLKGRSAGLVIGCMQVAKKKDKLRMIPQFLSQKSKYTVVPFFDVKITVGRNRFEGQKEEEHNEHVECEIPV